MAAACSTPCRVQSVTGEHQLLYDCTDTSNISKSQSFRQAMTAFVKQRAQTQFVQQTTDPL
jgi:hypothetical protein